MHYFYLALAVLGEVIGTSFLKATEDFTKLPRLSPMNMVVRLLGLLLKLIW